MRHVQPLNQKRNITIEMKESFPPKIHLTRFFPSDLPVILMILREKKVKK